MLMLISIFLAAAMVFLCRFLNQQHKAPIHGVYQQENRCYYVKFIFMYVSLSIRQAFNYAKRRRAVRQGKSDDGTIHVHTEDAKLEKIQPLGDYPLAADGVYFNGTSKTGAAFVCSVVRRKNAACDAFLYLKVEGGELMLAPKMPDSYLQQTPAEEDKYSVEGIVIKNVVPMRSWTLQYTGDMKLKNSEKPVKVELSLNWSTAFQPFNYDNISAQSMARDMAREPWSADYFKTLTKYHQGHYEQMGDIRGSAIVDGVKHVLEMPCSRDHSHSQHRDWRNFHRYVYHFIYLENGDCIAVGCASQPLTLSHLTLGYYCCKANQTVRPVTSSDFKLYQHGERQILPKDYGFIIKAGSRTYAIHVLAEDEDVFYMGKDREAKFYERWCKFQVNGIDGWGCTEWYYYNAQIGTSIK